MGRNGVGKTTLLKVIMGLLPAASGKIIPPIPQMPISPLMIRESTTSRM